MRGLPRLTKAGNGQSYFSVRLLLLLLLLLLLILISKIEIRTTAGADGGLPSIDDLRTLRPELAAAVQVFQNRIALATIEESPCHR
jgi:hypothetical protein